jgi:hypothetical protein
VKAIEQLRKAASKKDWNKVIEMARLMLTTKVPKKVHQEIKN